MYNLFVCETVSGTNLGPLDGDPASWKRELNGTDTGSCGISPGALTTKTRDAIRLVTTPARSTLVIEWSNPGETIGTPVFAGPIWNRPWDGKGLTINATGIRSILSRRKLVSWSAPYQTQVLAYQNASLAAIAAALVGRATDPAKTGAALPIVVPAITDPDTTHQKTYYGFDLKDADSGLTDLTNLLNGPDIDFVPVWADNNRSGIRYQMRIGTSAQPKLSSPNVLSFDTAQPESAVQGFTYVDDASTLATRQWGNGSGSDVDTIMSVQTASTLVAGGWPALEQQKDYKSELTQAGLDSAVSGDLVSNQLPTEQWGLTVDATLPPVLGSYLLGDKAKIRVANHVWVPDGEYLMRIISMGGNASTALTLGVQGA